MTSGLTGVDSSLSVCLRNVFGSNGRNSLVARDLNRHRWRGNGNAGHGSSIILAPLLSSRRRRRRIVARTEGRVDRTGERADGR